MPRSNPLFIAFLSSFYNTTLQLFTRVLTFVINGILLRYLSKDLLGVVNVRLTLLYSTLIFISSEAFRKACMSKSQHDRWQPIINLVWLTVPISAIFAVIFSLIWIYILEVPDPERFYYYECGVVAYSLSAVISMFAEPLLVTAQILYHVKLKVVSEALAVLTRSSITILGIIFYPRWGLIIFSIAEILYAVVIVSSHYIYFKYVIQNKKYDIPFLSMRELLPKIESNHKIFDKEMANLIKSFFNQSLIKQLLTEGEKYVMTFFNVLSFADQGVYDVISNLGSLVPRIIFMPFEQEIYKLFASKLKRGVSAHQQAKDDIKFSVEVIPHVLKILILIGLFISVFGFSYSYIALDIYGGSNLSHGSGTNLLRAFSIYVFIIAINGVTEAFSFAVMSEQEVNNYNKKMFQFSIILIVSSLLFTHLVGSLGFIIANSICMLARIINSLYFIYHFHKDVNEYPLKSIFPSRYVCAIFCLTFFLTALSEIFIMHPFGLYGRCIHISIGICLVIINIFMIHSCEKKLLKFLLHMIDNKKD